MSASTMSHPVLHLALELSVSSWVIAYRLPWSDKVRLQRVSAGDGAALLALISGLREKVAARIGPDLPWPVVSRLAATDFGCIAF